MPIHGESTIFRTFEQEFSSGEKNKKAKNSIILHQSVLQKSCAKPAPTCNNNSLKTKQKVTKSKNFGFLSPLETARNRRKNDQINCKKRRKLIMLPN